MIYGLLLWTFLFTASVAHADVFKCKTMDGIIYSQEPCPKDAVESGVINTTNPIIGTWLWRQDKVTFWKDGKGKYYRGGSLCFEFTYTIFGGNLNEKMDRRSSCSFSVEDQYHVAMNKRNLVLVHAGSGFITIWKHE